VRVAQDDKRVALFIKGKEEVLHVRDRLIARQNGFDKCTAVVRHDRGNQAARQPIQPALPSLTTPLEAPLKLGPKKWPILARF
jgi:hypothetical protein